MTSALLAIGRATSGNVAMLFAILLLPLLVGAGMGLDFMRRGQVDAALTEAADAGLLAAARARMGDDAMTDAQAQAIARKHFDANRAALGEVEIDNFDFTYDPATKIADLAVSGRVKTALLGVVGRHYLEIDILTEVEAVKPRALEVMLVLDNTWSMDGPKIVSLRSSAAALVDTIMADTDNEVKVGLVPFSTHVNMGMAREFEPWLDIPGPSSYDATECSVDAAAASAAGCSEGPSTCYSDGLPYSCTAWSCPVGDAPEICTTTPTPISWKGCVGSRPNPLNVQDQDFLSQPVPGVLNAGRDCPEEVMPMTIDKAAVEARIAAMTPQGDTYIPGGLFWGLAMISSDVPFTEGKPFDVMAADGGVKAIVLMTDGKNSVSPSWNGSHYDPNVAQSDGYTTDLCDEIKSKGIIVYTIAFEVADAATQALLEGCATSADAFFNAEDAGDLAAAFGEIGNSLQELALTR